MMTHGTKARYSDGCRCDDCRHANRDDSRERKGVEHGYYERRRARVLAERTWPAWYDDAPCRGQTALFFSPEREQGTASEAREWSAKRICGACPAMGECRDLGRQGREFGVWGGETELERARAGFGPELSIGATRRMVNEMARQAAAR